MGLHQNCVNAEQASWSKHFTVWNDVVDDRSRSILELLGDCHLLPHGRNSSLRFPVKVVLPSLKTAMGVDSRHSFRAFTRDCLVQMFFSLVMISRVGTFLPRELLLGCNRMLRLETNRRWSVQHSAPRMDLIARTSCLCLFLTMA